MQTAENSLVVYILTPSETGLVSGRMFCGEECCVSSFEVDVNGPGESLVPSNPPLPPLHVLRYITLKHHSSLQF